MIFSSVNQRTFMMEVDVVNPSEDICKPIHAFLLQFKTYYIVENIVGFFVLANNKIWFSLILIIGVEKYPVFRYSFTTLLLIFPCSVFKVNIYTPFGKCCKSKTVVPIELFI